MKNKRPFWIKTITNDEPAGNSDTTTTEETTNQQSEQEEKTSEDNTNDGEQDVDLEALKTQNANLEKERDEWRGHSRDWEKQSKENHKRIQTLEKQLEESISAETLNSIKAERDELSLNMAIITGLLNMGADAATLTDSRSFMDKATELNPTDDDFSDRLKTLAGEHQRKHPHLGRRILFDESNDGGKTDLWTLVHGAKDEQKGL